ncbi:MAG: glutamate synthase (NADPH), homotetrameric [Candidatus Omnitrophota bacterium]|nr:MAG: glutamate synthase (NADPH), homotetrameric [Candidatus Omnitrophota bacterium]
MRKQSPLERVHNFEEVNLGYSEEEAIAEANRCLECSSPSCVDGCPVGVDIPGFIKKIKKGDFCSALALIREKNNLPAICGRVCPQEKQCEKKCVLSRKDRAVAIGNLERFVADYCSSSFGRADLSLSSASVAVVGSGPAGLTTAGDLARLGYSVSVFEALHLPGGVLRYGIPAFRLPKEVLEREIEYIKSLGVEIKTDYVIGKIKGIGDLLKEGAKAVYIGIGAGLPRFLEIEGEDLVGVYSANEFLTRVNLMKAYLFPYVATPVRVGRKVAVIGGGNVALDSARTALRLGAERVFLLYRRSSVEMPARKEEFENAREEGVEFMFFTQPVRIIGGEKREVRGIECVRTELKEKDESGRPSPVPLPNSNFSLEVDSVIIAIGTQANPLLFQDGKELERTEKGYIKVDEEGRTSMKGVFAGGDIVTGSATVISAMGMAKKSALAIDRYIRTGLWR